MNNDNYSQTEDSIHATSLSDEQCSNYQYFADKDINITDYPDVINNYSFEQSLEDYSEKIKLYSCVKQKKLQCEFYSNMFTSEKSNIVIEDKDDEYEELSLIAESFNIDVNSTIILHKLILQDLNIPEEILNELLCLQYERANFCKTLIKLKNDKIVSIHTCYDLKNKDIYNSITDYMSTIIVEKYLKYKTFNLKQQQRIKDILLHNFLFYNAYFC